MPFDRVKDSIIIKH